MTFEEDPELLARLQAADPAAHLPPADPQRVARLLEDTMNTEQPTADHDRSEPAGPARRRSPLTWIAAAAAIAVLAGGGFWIARGDDPAPPAAAEQTVTTLDAPADAAAAKCQVPNAELLSTQTVAFDGTVTKLADGMATLEVGKWYAGKQTDVVEVRAPGEDLQKLILAVDFQEGKRYLVSATGGQVTVCGFSAEYSADLAALYDQAFGG